MHGARRGANSNNRQGWEQSEFPILCETCLGDNPYVRMTKNEYGSECKICARPFTVFRWKPGSQARYKKTEICQTCAKLKNVCQTCILDLRYGLPVQVRDTVEPHNVEIPVSDVNREYYAQINEQKLAETGTLSSTPSLAGGKIPHNSEMLHRLQRREPYYKRNRAHICSFFVKGTCTRGSECPYRHELPQTGELAEQNLKDRYFGVNDPVAKKILNKAGDTGSLQPPEDKTITTLYIGGVKDHITEQDLRDVFYAFGEIQAIRMVPRATCAFVTFVARSQAEKAAENLAGRLSVKDTRLNLQWGKPLSAVHGREAEAQPYPFAMPLYPSASPHFKGSGHDATAHVAYPMMAGAYIPRPVMDPAGAGASRMYYPSMDPQRRGSAPDKHGSSADA